MNSKCGLPSAPYSLVVQYNGYEHRNLHFVEQLDDEELTTGYFQQDGLACHSSNKSITLVESFLSRSCHLEDVATDVA